MKLVKPIKNYYIVTDDNEIIPCSDAHSAEEYLRLNHVPELDIAYVMWQFKSQGHNYAAFGVNSTLIYTSKEAIISEKAA